MDKELLFKPSLPEEAVEIPGKGTVRVRALTRAEMHRMNQKRGNKQAPDSAEVERRTIVAGLVDPELTYDEVCQWYEIASVGEVQPVVRAIMDLSGMGDGADKSGVPGDGDES